MPNSSGKSHPCNGAAWSRAAVFFSNKGRLGPYEQRRAVRFATADGQRLPAHVAQYISAAYTATAHKLARLIYSMLRYRQDYVDAGAEYYESQYQQRALRTAKRRAYQLGYQLVPMSVASDHIPGVPLNPAAMA